MEIDDSRKRRFRTIDETPVAASWAFKQLCASPELHSVGDVAYLLDDLGRCAPSERWLKQRSDWSLARAYRSMMRLDWLVWLYATLEIPRAAYSDAVEVALEDAGDLVPVPLALRWADGDGKAGADICALALKAAGDERWRIMAQLRKGRALRDHVERYLRGVGDAV